MSRERFKALMGVHHVVDPNTENPREKLRKVQWVDKKKCPPPIIILVLVNMMYNKQ